MSRCRACQFDLHPAVTRAGRGVGFLALLVALAAVPATTEPVIDTGLRRAVADLANADDAVRADARARLLALSAERLADLRAATHAARPLLPSQSEMLRDIVRHVYLTGLPYEHTGRAFVGITMAEEDELVRIQSPGAPPEETEERLGVRVTHRWPGFAGYRWLLDGDVIVRVEEFPASANGASAFSEAVGQCHPGDTITLHVLRQGQIIKIPIVLDARPPLPGGPPIDAIKAFVAERDPQADQYWNENFAQALE